MTYKHINFFDSPTMRSLERLAHEKGLVKKEFVKKASINEETENFYASTNLTENILKLCSGLSKKGFHSFASEIEDNFVQYKQAQTLYETSKEKGEDLVHDAHPKGSHKLENVDSKEAVFEDILDRHLKMLNVVNKKPSGKLSNAQSVIHAVKMIFADDSKKVQEINNALQNNISFVLADLDKIKELTADNLTFSIDGPVDRIKDKLTTPTIDNLKDAQSMISTLNHRIAPTTLDHFINPTSLFMGVSDEVKGKLNATLTDLNANISQAVSNKIKLQEIDSEKYLQEAHGKLPTGTNEDKSNNSNINDDKVSVKFAYTLKVISFLKDRVTSSPTIDATIKSKLLAFLDKAYTYTTNDFEKYKNSNKTDTIVQDNFMKDIDSVKEQLDIINSKYFNNAAIASLKFKNIRKF